MPELRIFLLGTPHLDYDNLPVNLTRRKVIALLAYLATTRQPRSRETVATLLWPDFGATSAHAYLRNALWLLKQTPVEAWLETEQDMVGLRQDDSLWVDVTYFEANLAACKAHQHPEHEVCEVCIPLLKEAVALYQGDFISGFTLEDSADFDEWQFFQSESLRRAMTGALEKLVLWHSQYREPEVALDYARRWQSLDPLHEGAQRQLMTLYAQLDQRATALHLYEALIRDLRAQGLKPADKTVALYQHIRAGDIPPSSVRTEMTDKPVLKQDILKTRPTLTPEFKPRHNLPVQTTAFFGRLAELSKLHQLFDDPDARMITVTGAGGSGKTRLALRAAEESIEAFPDGVFFVPLAAVYNPDHMISTLADVLGVVIYQQATVNPPMHLPRHIEMTSYLHQKRILLILDNLEQVQSGATILAEILQATQTVKLLVTSRERLNVQGEWVIELNGLRYPEEERTKNAEKYAAVNLFLERARRVSRDFSPTSDELSAIVRISRLVQGLPLGLELAAAWTRFLSCHEIAEEIATNLDFLSFALRDMPERHHSLRAVFTHSWGLLSQEERICYCALSVFRGGFTRSAATDVAKASLTTLASLMDKSMLFRTTSGRYEILEVLRQYAEDQLTATPEESERVHNLHCDYYLELLRKFEPVLKAPGKDATFGQLAALDAIQQDLENIRAAWHWGVSQNLTKTIHTASFSLGLFCDIRSRFRDGLELFEEAITAFDRPGLDITPECMGLLLGIRGNYLSRLSMPKFTESYQHSIALLDACEPGMERALVNVLSSYASEIFPPDEIERRLNDSLMIYTSKNDLWGMALTLEVMAECLDPLIYDNFEIAKLHGRQSLELWQQVGNHWGIAVTLFTLGTMAQIEGAYTDAQRYYQQSLETRQELKELNGAAHCLHNLGRIAYEVGDQKGAYQLLKQSLAVFSEIGSRRGIARSLQNLAAIAYDQGNLEEAQTLLIEACSVSREISEAGRELADILLQLGNISWEMTDHATARTAFEESQRLYQKLEDAECYEKASTGLRMVIE